MAQRRELDLRVWRAKGYDVGPDGVLRRRATPPPVRTLPSLAAPPRVEETVLHAIEDLAQTHGWHGWYSWNAQGDDPGLRCILWRHTDVIVGHVQPPGVPLTRTQQRDLTTLQSTGCVEVVEWRIEDLEAIRARLSRPEDARALAPQASRS